MIPRLIFRVRHFGRGHRIETRYVRPFAAWRDRLIVTSCACGARIVAGGL